MLALSRKNFELAPELTVDFGANTVKNMVSAGIARTGRTEDMLIGREKEQRVLSEAFQADDSRFVAVYGFLLSVTGIRSVTESPLYR